MSLKDLVFRQPISLQKYFLKQINLNKHILIFKYVEKPTKSWERYRDRVSQRERERERGHHRTFCDPTSCSFHLSTAPTCVCRVWFYISWTWAHKSVSPARKPPLLWPVICPQVGACPGEFFQSSFSGWKLWERNVFLLWFWDTKNRLSISVQVCVVYLPDFVGPNSFTFQMYLIMLLMFL